MSVLYLNNAGTSWPKAPGVADAVAEVLAADPRSYAARYTQARASIADSLGAADPQRLWLTPGCTSALCVAVETMPWARGDVVVTSALEHEAVLSPVRRLQANAGVEHVAIGRAPQGPLDLEQLSDILVRRPVRAVVMTAASNVTGECLPIEAVVQRCREAGVRVIVDAAQTAGLLPLHLETLGADAVTVAGHKGPMAPQGVGALWLREGFELPVGYCDLGSVDLPATVAMARSLRWLAEDAPPGEQAVALRNRLWAALAEREGCRVFGEMGPSTGAVSAVFDALPLAEGEARFADAGIVVRSGRHCAPQALATLRVPEGTVRFSFGRMNDANDVDAVLRVVDVAARGVE
ncbi:MAG: aminotransferase class V-fold PLP-dependent enzyme [Myxococcota bacterium]